MAPGPFLGAVGIGVSSIEASLKFYRDVLQIGLGPTQTFDVDSFKEVVLAFPRGSKPTGSQILLMEYKGGVPRPRNQQGKLVFYVEDVEEVLDRCKAFGSEVFWDLGKGKDWTRELAMVRDPDGFLVELMPLKFLRGVPGGSKI